MTAPPHLDAAFADDAEVYDLLIVGGGPAGTAAAFRGRELGLRVVVLEFDDLMKRIRDYSKDKLILPGFGGGDRMRFPKGGGLVADLRFAAIDKDELCACFKELYRRHDVPVRLACELTGLEPVAGGYRVIAWDHGQRGEIELRCRCIVLAIGRGVPRRFDLPGDTDGICYRLGAAETLVGEPACVIGGGTSAAEAVIAISNAKAAAGDPSAVYWSYRGDRMPRVSKALAEVFFEAYVGNGNILYFPRSEPAAIVTADDRREYLAIRVDRRQMSGRPNETTYLEFAKTSCVACIGEDIPERLLNSLGIHMKVGGARGKKRMLVSRGLESERANVFLAGDLLSPAYLETDDFAGDEAGFREVKHRGNIKAALRDGVLVAEIVARRLAGESEDDVVVGDDDDLPAVDGTRVLSAASTADGPPVASLECGREPVAGEAFLIRVLPSGVQEGEHPLRPDAVTTIGRLGTDLAFPDDTLLAERHASIVHHDQGFHLRDDGSQSGVFLRVAAAKKRELGDGDLLRVGRQFLLFARVDGDFAFTHYDAQGQERGHHPLAAGTVVLGRQAPDVTLDADDLTLSRRQLALTVEDGRLFAKDLKSVNGSYLRVRGATRLEQGDEIRVGQQRLVFSLQADAVLDVETEAAGAAPAVMATPEPRSDGATVTFTGSGQTLPLRAGRTICEVAEAHGLAITAECHSGICGSDPIRIVAGGEHLDEPSEQERETLTEICDLEPGDCRLACMVRPRGAVKVEILDG